jgi:hypothetical protein
MPRKGDYKSGAKADSVRQRKYNSQSEQKKNRAARNKARREAAKAGKVRKGDGKDVDHKRQLGQGGSRSTSNTRVASRHSNRSRGGRLGGKR